MKQPLVSALRSVEIGLPDVAAAEKFYTETWNLSVAARRGDSVYLRGTGADHHLLSLHRASKPEIRMVTLRAASADALGQVAESVRPHGGEVLAPRHNVAEPGGGEAVVIRDPQGRIIRIVSGDVRHADTQGHKDRPSRLAHAVMNSHDVASGLKFYEDALGMRLADRTRIMAFIRIPVQPRGDHHSIALADADNDCLNHIAFVMPDLESVMRGGGRMKDAGYGIEWGPGRHGPGNNSFNYFVGPAGFVIEYTADVEQVDDTYPVRGPDDWKWPAGRVDHWGISAPPSPKLKEAQRQIVFADGLR
ncbi:MAG: VOC family protein [Ramlibacter sp.]